MKESIQQSGQDISIVIYDAPLPPRYLKFSKKFMRTLFVLAPLTIGLIFFALLAYGIGSRVRSTPVPSLPTVVSDDESKVQELTTELEALRTSNQQLQDKLSGQVAPTSPESADELYLMGIKKPYGMQNLISQNRVTLDQFDFSQDSSKVSLKFQITSTNPETKVTGHILVFMISQSGLMIYPAAANPLIGGAVKYSMGEPFSVSRLRPTNAEFAQKLFGESVKFVVYIFSREGDLLQMKETESYKVGAK